MRGEGTPPEWDLLSSRVVGRYSMFDVREDRVRVPRTGSEHTFHVAVSADGVTVLALTPEHELVLVEQFRGPLWSTTLELPSGILEEGEDPVEAGLRELREETGFVGEGATLLGTLTLNPSWQTTRVHVLLAERVKRAASRDLDAAEDTRVRTLPLERVRAMVREGGIDSAVAVAALAFMQLQQRFDP